MSNKLKVGILLFDEVEVLDFAGPYEVFSLAQHQNSEEKLFDVKTVAESKEIISARNGLKIMPDLSYGGEKQGEPGFEPHSDASDALDDDTNDDPGESEDNLDDLKNNHPKELKNNRQNALDFDLLIVPGGRGASEIEIHNQRLIAWLKAQSKQVKIMASVCTGAFLLAEAGLLQGKKATTHWSAIERLQQDYPEVKVQSYLKYVDEGDIITAAGISAGIDMSLYLLKKLFDQDLAKYTSRRLEFVGEFS